MNNTKRTLDLNARPKLRLSEVDRLLRKERIIVPPLSRRTLVKLCETGVLEFAPRRTLRAEYLVFEDSFLKWVQRLDAEDDPSAQ